MKESLKGSLEQTKNQEIFSKEKIIKKQPFTFKPLRYLKLKDIFSEIRNFQFGENEQSMFPMHFTQLHKEALDTYFFQIEVQDLYKKWSIIKRLPELVQLKQILQLYFPESPLIFSFPEPQQSEIQSFIAQSILQLFCAFLNSISKSEEICQQKQFLLFIENWVSSDRKKVKTLLQRKLIKKAGGRHTDSGFARIMYNFVSWRHKFFTVTNEGVYYTDTDDSFSVKQMLLFNQSFTMLHGEIKTGYTFGIVLNSSHRVLQIDAENVFNFLLFIYVLRKLMSQNVDSKTNRYNSFARVRQGCGSTFYIDGKEYFGTLYQELLKAKKQVYITGWFLTPHMYLVQKFDGLQHRVDKVFERLALSGVKIYIIVYNAPRIAIDINPEFTESYLTSLHSNIKVLRHPNYMFIPFLWSHHQKMVIIDHKVAFMGGFDIGYGRMDDNQHKLSDEGQTMWKGIEYCNYRISDLNQIHLHEVCSIDRLTQPRLPWHDVGIAIMGPSVMDMSRHFIQYWNYASYQLYLTERQLILFTGIHEEELQATLEQEDQQQRKFKECSEKKQKSKNSNVNVNEFQIPNKQHNLIKVEKQILDFKKTNLQKHFQQEIKLSKVKQKSRHSFKTNHLKNNKFHSFVSQSPVRFIEVQPELKKQNSTQYIIEPQEAKQAQKSYYINFLKSHHSISEKTNQNKIQLKKQESKLSQIQLADIILTYQSDINVLKKSNDTNQNIKFKQTHQILRSAALWSLGLKEGKQQKSILQAYLSLIQNSKHFIYIQNQFFISVENLISTKIVERIQKASQNKELFKVLIVIPFLPGFQGQIQDDNSAVFRVQLDFIYKTICRGQNSLLGRLSYMGNLEDYLAIYCLRNHGTINGIPATQIVYVHSKVMIVDDSVALIGSANINDRSLMGDRDSQIAVIVQDSQELEIGNQSHNLPKIKVKKFAHQLRKQLCMEHFGLQIEEAEHFLNEKVWDKMQFNAQRNQKIYRKLFGCYPDDGIKNFSDIKKFQQEAEPQRYEELKVLIKGYACPFQKEFLCNESLELHSGQKEYYIPVINFT